MNIGMQSKIFVNILILGCLFDIEAMRTPISRTRDTSAKRDSMVHKGMITTRRHLQPQPRNMQLARQLSPQRTFTRMGRFGQFRVPQRLRAQRHYLNRVFRGHNWYWWWRHRPRIFYAYFPFFFYNTYGYYPPIYYDYFDVYGTYPIAYSYTVPA